MNQGQFKDHVAQMWLEGTVAVSWSLATRGANIYFEPFVYNDKYFVTEFSESKEYI